MATIVGLFEAKTNLGQIVKRAAGGEDIVITNRGNPLVRLVPADAGPAVADPLHPSKRLHCPLLSVPAPFPRTIIMQVKL